MTMKPVGLSQEDVINSVTVGGFYCVGLDYGIISPKELQKIAENIESLKDTIRIDNIYTDEAMGEILNAVSKAYFIQLNMYDLFLESRYNVVSTKLMSEAMTGYDVEVKHMFMSPVEVKEGSLYIDVDRNAQSVISVNGDKQAEKAYMILSGQIASAMEHGIFEQMTGIPSVSTMKVLHEANERGIPLYTVTKDNIKDVLEILEVGQAVKNGYNEVLNVLAFLQAAMDFPEDVEESSIEAQLEEILVETEELVKNARTAEVLRKGINLVIAGRPNVGKSSLMNALVGMERSIVSQIPGTTRDYVEQYTVLGKIPVNVVDTAGLRHTDDPIEQEGVKLALSRIAEADLVIFLYDASLGWTEEDQQMLNLVQEEKTIVVGNKIDKGKAPNQHPKAYFISAKEKTGLEKLIEAIHQVMNVTEPPKLLVSQRQMGLLEKTLNDIRDALEHLSVYAEVAADDLFSSLRHLTALTSEMWRKIFYTRSFPIFASGSNGISSGFPSPFLCVFP